MTEAAQTTPPAPYFIGGPLHGQVAAVFGDIYIHITHGQVPHRYVLDMTAIERREFYVYDKLQPLEAKRMHDILMFEERRVIDPTYATEESAGVYNECLRKLIDAAAADGVMLTVEQFPLLPLGQGNYVTTWSARPVRDPHFKL